MKTLLIAGATLLATAPAATAQLPPTTPPTQEPPSQQPPSQQPTSPPQPQPKPAKGRGAIGIASGLSTKGKRYLAAGQRVRVRGRVKPFVEGQQVIVELFRGSKRIGGRTVPVKQARDGKGAFAVVMRVRGAGRYTIKARHQATDQQERFTMSNKRFRALGGGVGSRSGSTRIRLVQLGLKRLAYVTSTGGRWDGATSRAVLAFRKTNRMSRTSTVSKKVFSMLLSGRGGYRLKYPRAGRHVEADLSRQVLVLADKGRAVRIYHTSTGTPATPTVVGSFRFYRRQPGTNSKEMVHSWYFIRGYAIHGYKSVPTRPASHGCLRVPIPNALSIFRWIRMGDRIFVYR